MVLLRRMVTAFCFVYARLALTFLYCTMMFAMCSDRRTKANEVKGKREATKKGGKSPKRTRCCTRLAVPCSICVAPVSLVPSHQYAPTDAFALLRQEKLL